MSIPAIEQDTRWEPPQNRDEIVDNSTTPEQRSTETNVVVPEQLSDKEPENHATQHSASVPNAIEPLTAEEIKFTRLVAKGISATTAYRQAFPHKNKLTYNSVRVLAHRLLTKTNIQTEVATVKNTTAMLARLAEDRIEQILVHDESDTRGSKVAEVAMFMYEHANGKAKQTTEMISKSVSVNIDLTGQLEQTE